MAVLIEDTFDGAGLLSAHTGNSGVTWAAGALARDLTLNGTGGVYADRGSNQYSACSASVALPAIGEIRFYGEFNVPAIGCTAVGFAVGNATNDIGYLMFEVASASYTTWVNGVPDTVASTLSTGVHTLLMVLIAARNSLRFSSDGVLVAERSFVENPAKTQIRISANGTNLPSDDAGETRYVLIEQEIPPPPSFWTNFNRTHEVP